MQAHVSYIFIYISAPSGYKNALPPTPDIPLGLYPVSARLDCDTGSYAEKCVHLDVKNGMGMRRS